MDEWANERTFYQIEHSRYFTFCGGILVQDMWVVIKNFGSKFQLWIVVMLDVMSTPVPRSSDFYLFTVELSWELKPFAFYSPTYCIGNLVKMFAVAKP